MNGNGFSTFSLTTAIAMAGVVGLTACGSGPPSSAPAASQTCWQTGVGLVVKTVETGNTFATQPCSAQAALVVAGNPVLSGPVSGLGAPICTYSFASGITWNVWQTDGGASGNAQALCDTLASES